MRTSLQAPSLWAQPAPLTCHCMRGEPASLVLIRDQCQGLSQLWRPLGIGQGLRCNAMTAQLLSVPHPVSLALPGEGGVAPETIPQKPPAHEPLEFASRRVHDTLLLFPLFSPPFFLRRFLRPCAVCCNTLLSMLFASNPFSDKARERLTRF